MDMHDEVEIIFENCLKQVSGEGIAVPDAGMTWQVQPNT